MIKWKKVAFFLWLISLLLTTIMCIQLGLPVSSTFWVVVVVGFHTFLVFGGLAIILVALDGMAKPNSQMKDLVAKDVLPDVDEV